MVNTDGDRDFPEDTRETVPEGAQLYRSQSSRERLDALIRAERDSLHEFTSRKMRHALRGRLEPSDVLQTALSYAWRKIDGLREDSKLVP